MPKWPSCRASGWRDSALDGATAAKAASNSGSRFARSISSACCTARPPKGGRSGHRSLCPFPGGESEDGQAVGARLLGDIRGIFEIRPAQESGG